MTLSILTLCIFVSLTRGTDEVNPDSKTSSSCNTSSVTDLHLIELQKLSKQVEALTVLLRCISIIVMPVSMSLVKDVGILLAIWIVGSASLLATYL